VGLSGSQFFFDNFSTDNHDAIPLDEPLIRLLALVVEAMIGDQKLQILGELAGAEESCPAYPNTPGHPSRERLGVREATIAARAEVDLYEQIDDVGPGAASDLHAELCPVQGLERLEAVFSLVGQSTLSFVESPLFLISIHDARLRRLLSFEGSSRAR
jgi:hypothetical protein